MNDLLITITQLEGITAERDRKIAEVSAMYEPGLDTGRQRRDELELALKAYYYDHLTELEAEDKKSVQLVNGVMGRRDNPPKLALRNRSWGWGTVLVSLRAKFGERFIRTREPEIDKDRVKAEIPEEALGEFGMRLDRDEKFYVEPARLPAEVNA
jgi:phage host-nuclease inhibitor protein Gam